MSPRGDGPRDGERAERGAAVLPQRLVVRLLPVFAAAAGSLDAVCVTHFGGVFASVITGNLVQLGRAVAAPDGRLAVGATVAVGCYALGVAGGTAGLGRRGAGWHRRASLVAAAELALLAGVAAGWLATDGRPDARTTSLLLALAAAAMGMQSAITIGSGVQGASTTYLTGALTGLVRGLTGEPHRFAADAAARVGAFLCGATAGALLLRFASSWAPILPVALVGLAVVIAAASTGARVERS
ncbi:YoaK family protein [Streptomyces sp. NPDC057445]|uniref:YoaK family protein n=1 Tax=Streptomyces sp. NPDC057445 TaxID=3346136 RepID=UPI003685733D